MANRYVYSGAGGAATGADWANAHLTLAAAITASSAGDTFFVASDHSHNYGASTTLTFKGTLTAPDRIVSVNRAGSVPPVAADVLAGALEGTNAASTNLTINGNFYSYGVTFAVGSGQSTSCDVRCGTSGSPLQVYDNCQFHLLSTGTSSQIRMPGLALAKIKLIAPKFKFSATAQQIDIDGGQLEVFGDPANSILASGSSVPTTLFAANAINLVVISGCDLSALSGTLFGTLATPPADIRLVNCKLHASATITATPTVEGPLVSAISANSANNVARSERYHYRGTLTTETTIKRTTGASDGATAYSWKLVTTANAKRDFPLETFEGVVWNDAGGASKTLTVHTVTDNVTLTDAEIWLEVEYLGDVSYPVTTLITDANATVLTTAANQASSTETWTTTGLTTPVKQKLEVTFTPQMAGLIRWKVKVAKASTTAYVCPKPEIS